MVSDLEIESLQDPHREPGYFELEGLELSKPECFAIDAVALLLFVAAHNLLGDTLPASMRDLPPTALAQLRAEAAEVAALVLAEQLSNRLPLQVSVAPGESTFALRSRGRHGPHGPSSAPGPRG